MIKASVGFLMWMGFTELRFLQEEQPKRASPAGAEVAEVALAIPCLPWGRASSGQHQPCLSVPSHVFSAAFTSPVCDNAQGGDKETPTSCCLSGSSSPAPAFPAP